MAIIHPNLTQQINLFFTRPTNITHKQYEALRAFFVEKLSAGEVAQRFGYQRHSVYALIKTFRESMQNATAQSPFFLAHSPGRKERDVTGEISEKIVRLRKHYLSTPDIKVLLDAEGTKVSERYIWTIIEKEGFGRLPRRGSKAQRDTRTQAASILKAPKSETWTPTKEQFSTNNAGLLSLIPYIKRYGIDQAIGESKYPATSVITKQASLLSFLALKLSDIRRYSVDDLWCMDRGMGLFAGLNVLPKAAWFSSYSHRVTRDMNIEFLKSLHRIWKKNGLLSDTINLDYTTIPYWGEGDHLENNWSGKRHTAMVSMLAVLAQDPDSGIIDYGDTNIRHRNEANVILEFLDFYHAGNVHNETLKYLVFDSKFTTYHNLNTLNEKGIKFVTIRRRGKSVVAHLNTLPAHAWKKIHVMNADGKGRTLRVHEELITLKDYDKPVRQIAITGHGKIKPALIITNEFEKSLETMIRKYSRRWLVEKGISEQIEFFHLNRLCSSMVIKVDFDLTMSILAHNLYRLFAQDLDGYTHQTDQRIFEQFLHNSGEVVVKEKTIEVKLKKKRNLPILLDKLNKYCDQTIPWLNNLKISFAGATTS